MKYCRHCKVSVTGHWRQCPLCQHALSGEDTAAPFPEIQEPPSKKIVVRLLLFLSMVPVALCALINLALPDSGVWSLFVAAGVLCMWLSLGIAFLKRHTVLKNIAWQAFVLSVLAILWDHFTHWHAWSVNFVVPSILLITMLLTPLLAVVLQLTPGAYLVYFCIVSLFGLVPVAFLLLGIATVPLPSIICVGVSLISLIALVVFSGRTMLDELYRRLHL